MTKPNVVSEAPPGVARNAGVEGVGRRRRTSTRRSRARERKCFAIGPAPATGEGVRGDVRDVPRSHPQAGGPALTTLRAPCMFLRSKVVTLRAPCLFLRSKVVTLRAAPHVLALKSCYPPGSLSVLVAMQSSNIKLTRDLKAEINLRTPRRPPGITGIVPTDCRRPGMKKSPVLWNFPF